MGVFLTIRDAYGTTQLILPEQVSSRLGGVSLCGWVQYQRMGIFLTIRDAYGTTQLILPEQVSSGLGGVSASVAGYSTSAWVSS